MKPSEFEERAFEAPLYNQLERGSPLLWAPGQVLEHRIGFDRGLFVAETAVWETLGHGRAPPGAALAYYPWPPWWGPREPRRVLPDFRLNLFLQAKRCHFSARTPAKARAKGLSGSCYAFWIESRQQRFLRRLAKQVGKRAHVSYAAPAFYTHAQLRAHTRGRSVVPHSTFPHVDALARHDAWYYQAGGATGVANPDPTFIELPPLEARLASLVDESRNDADTVRDGSLSHLDLLAADIRTLAAEAPDDDTIAPGFLDDLQTLERLIEPFELRPSLTAYATISLFAATYSLDWLVVGRAA